ncbi:hypothetical protein CQ018_15055 [Arthrobacter sp. MYb227]|uniref:hypothetical protein n=1 Tax=Arthrobacter sp. MYb227 TaxID=1848601 RepID=UPI000CFBCD9F|nr:hypothetical protein [Arthrobacter sp. MYb227]PQZ90305.1 hypothetical protein CQ018_15055 [Arthrobacter sp. MYb227]
MALQAQKSNSIRSKFLKIATIWSVSLLLAGCVPLDSPEPSASSVSAFESALNFPPDSVTPHSPEDEWNACTDPVIKPGKPVKSQWKIITLAERDTRSGLIEETLLHDETHSMSLSFDVEIPNGARFNQQISDALEAPVSGEIGGPDQIWNSLRSVKESSVLLGFSAFKPLTIPFSMGCENQFTFGELYTWNNSEFGILDCSLKPSESAESAPAFVRKTYCTEK